MGNCYAPAKVNIISDKYSSQDNYFLVKSKSYLSEDEYLSSDEDKYNNVILTKYGIILCGSDYNISKKDKEMRRNMNRMKYKYANTYIDKATYNLEKYMEMNKTTNEILSVDVSRKVKASDILREISKQIVTNNVVTEYSKNTVIATLELAARAMDGVIKENDFQKLVCSFPKQTSNSNDELVDNDKIITIKESQIHQFVENDLALDSFLKLEYNWNNNGAKQFSKEIIKKMKNLIAELPYQPEIFPTARESIQFEYEKEDGTYLEFELFEDEKLKIFTLSSNDEEETEIAEFDISKVIKVVSEFYE